MDGFAVTFLNWKKFFMFQTYKDFDLLPTEIMKLDCFEYYIKKKKYIYSFCHFND